MSFTHMATRSTPMVSWIPVSMAIFTFVPTPSLAATRIGSLKPAAFRSNSPPKPPISASAPGRRVARTRGLIASTMALPASISTPESAYVRPFFLLSVMRCPGLAAVRRFTRPRQAPRAGTGGLLHRRLGSTHDDPEPDHGWTPHHGPARRGHDPAGALGGRFR